MATTTHNPMAQGGSPAFVPPTADQPAEPLTIQQIFAQVDTDHSGTIDFEEFAEWWNSKQVQTRGAVDEDAPPLLPPTLAVRAASTISRHRSVSCRVRCCAS